MENRSSDRENEAVELHAKDELIKKHLPLVKKAAARFAMRVPPSVTFDELMSAGHLGLIDAAGKFDPGRHVSFETYAGFRIRGSILDELRSLDKYPRSLRQKNQELEKAIAKVENREGRTAEEIEIAEELGINIEEYHELLKDVHSIAFFSLDASIRNSYNNSQPSNTRFQDQLKGDDSPEKKLDEKELKKFIAKAIDTLSDTEKKVVTLYYYEELTLKEIGEIFERTESRICQIHSAAIVKLRSKINLFEH
ncbi:MAG: FliA/WhiG family RNA polymerase sigma factor [Desulforegulaceae bacterium]|nr:FliA/WhiG family RNA polymerase sigma factor [Desulforegulaceae bacterium]